ncbi:MAG TPA: CpaF family protein [Anaerolineae bacterium]|nr:CpaF family protein [Anaerolineae bacterium]HIQ04370.1 CpaF family protein [Anaerolineae bacterium]
MSTLSHEQFTLKEKDSKGLLLGGEPRPEASGGRREERVKLPTGFHQVKNEVQQRLLRAVTPEELTDRAQAERIIEPIFNEVVVEARLVLSRHERHRLFEMVLDEILGYGPIQPLLDDATVNEIMVNGPKQVYIERGGKLELTDVEFEDEDHVMRVIERIVQPLGRRIDEAQPMVDARLPDGSRVNAIIPPLSLVGPVLTIRKFRKIPFTVEDLIANGTFSAEFAQFAEAAVQARLNIVVSGGTGSGKTTLLNVLSTFIPHDERIITIEDAAELQLQQPHWVQLESRPPNIEGKGQVTIRDLVINALRMRPDRIVVGEVRGGEALDMLQAMNTGHDGSLTTVHSNSPRDTLLRIETMVLMAGMDLPLRAIRQQIASAIDLIVHQERLRDGSRKVVKVSEVLGMEGETILMQDIFEFQEEGMDVNGRIIGSLQPTGIRPKVADRIEAAHIHLPPQIFGLDRLLPPAHLGK